MSKFDGTDRTDDYYERIRLPWWAVLLLLVLLAASLISCEGPCGCPFMTVCQPDLNSSTGYVCVPAPRSEAETPGDGG